MRHLLILCALSLLACCFTACTRGPIVVSQGQITIIEANIAEAGYFYCDTLTIALGPTRNYYTLSHELGHCADFTGLPYATVMAQVGKLPPHLHNQWLICQEVLAETKRNPGPDAHWKALRTLYGAKAVRHEEIIARIGK